MNQPIGNGFCRSVRGTRSYGTQIRKLNLQGRSLKICYKKDGVTFEGKEIPLGAARALNVVAEFVASPKAFQAMAMLDNARNKNRKH